MVQRCWHPDPTSRPQILVLQILILQFRERLIGYTLTADERIHLIATIFSDDDQVEVVESASGEDAQTLIDLIDEASPSTISRSKDRFIQSDLDLHILSIRR